MDEELCQNCIYVKKTENDFYDVKFFCRRYPPQLDSNNVSSFPEVMNNYHNWCGEYKTKGTKNEKVFY
jgi:hypothetical protein